LGRGLTGIPGNLFYIFSNIPQRRDIYILGCGTYNTIGFNHKGFSQWVFLYGRFSGIFRRATLLCDFSWEPPVSEVLLFGLSLKGGGNVGASYRRGLFSNTLWEGALTDPF